MRSAYSRTVITGNVALGTPVNPHDAVTMIDGNLDFAGAGNGIGSPTVLGATGFDSMSRQDALANAEGATSAL